MAMPLMRALISLGFVGAAFGSGSFRGGGVHCDCLTMEDHKICGETCDLYSTAENPNGKCTQSTTTALDGSFVMYPNSYGSSCRKWIEPGQAGCWNMTSNTERTDAGKASWCDSPWCLVDPCTCNYTEGISSPAYSATAPGGKPVMLAYSYSNCDAVDEFAGTEGSNFQIPANFHQWQNGCPADSALCNGKLQAGYGTCDTCTTNPQPVLNPTTDGRPASCPGYSSDFPACTAPTPAPPEETSGAEMSMLNVAVMLALVAKCLY